MVGGQGITVSPKQTFKLIGSGSSFLRKGFGLRSNSAKRKSAVELLQESKAFYVKSEKVLDTKQELKHTEHLQVSSNPNIELLLKAPKNNNTTSSTYITNSNTILCDTKPPLPTPRRSPSNASNCTNGETKRKNSVSDQTHTTLINGIGNNITTTTTTTTRCRSKTQPETILRSDVAILNGKVEYRRNHSENLRYCSDNLQKMLRGLLDQADSKENINKKTDDSNSPIRSGDAILKPRQQQECNYSIHKSMPDLSPTKLGIGRSPKARSSRATSPTPTNTTVTETSTSGSLSLLVHKSMDLKRSHSHNTSDYVSCSPSNKEDGIKTGLNDLSAVEENDGVEDGESKRRPILRSKSDISHRFSKCTTEFLDTRHRVVCKSEGELERFFNSMGLEVNTLRTILSPPPLSNSPIFFSSTSSIDSSKRGGREGSDSSPPSVRRTQVSVTGGLNSKDLMHHGHAETSIVERNARVIKWLFNCRKANENAVKS